MQFPIRPLEAGSKSTPTELRVKMSNFIAERNMFTAFLLVKVHSYDES